jgi:hypothetical protein
MMLFRIAQSICVFGWLLFAAAAQAAGAGAGAGAAQAPQLVMAGRVDCPWCLAWHREVGPGYPHSDEGKLAPLREVDLDQAWPADLPKARGILYTPTFLLVACGREIGRITGYPGADFFYPKLDALLEQLKGIKNTDGTCA